MTTEEKSEEWRDVIGYEGYYQISNFGRVKSFKKWNNKNQSRILKGYSKNGYPVVSLNTNPRKEYYVHRLVAKCFLGDHRNMEVNHKDGDRTNNALDNLEWVTHSGNIIHAYGMGRCNRGHVKGKIPHNAIRIITVNETSIIEFPTIKHAANYLDVPEYTLRRRVDTNKQIKGQLIYSL